MGSVLGSLLTYRPQPDPTVRSQGELVFEQAFAVASTGVRAHRAKQPLSSRRSGSISITWSVRLDELTKDDPTYHFWNTIT
jgi:hypothetical protein